MLGYGEIPAREAAVASGCAYGRTTQLHPLHVFRVFRLMFADFHFDGVFWYALLAANVVVTW